MRDNRRHSAHIVYRMLVGLPAELVQFGQELDEGVLVNIICFGTIHASMGAEMELVPDDAFDYRLGIESDQTREDFVGLLVIGLEQERLEEGIDPRVDFGRRLVHWFSG
jgi:hypothetical protein